MRSRARLPFELDLGLTVSAFIIRGGQTNAKLLIERLRRAMVVRMWPHSPAPTRSRSSTPPKTIENRGSSQVCEAGPTAEPRFGVCNAAVFNIGTLHEYLSSLYKVPGKGISLLKNRLNLVL